MCQADTHYFSKFRKVERKLERIANKISNMREDYAGYQWRK